MKFDAEVVKIEEVGFDAAITCNLLRQSPGGVIERGGEVTFRVSLRRGSKWHLGRRVKVTIDPAK